MLHTIWNAEYQFWKLENSQKHDRDYDIPPKKGQKHVPKYVQDYGGFIDENETGALTAAIFDRFSIFQRQMKRLSNHFKFINCYF